MAKNTERPRIAIVGGGIGGLCAAVQIQKQFGPDEPLYTIFEENEDFGGTWLMNKYPGLECDVPSHLYSFSFELNPHWTKNHAPGPEILAYLLKIARKYDLYKKARFSTSVTNLEWLPEENCWKLWAVSKQTGEAEELYFNYVISATGTLRWPFIPPEFENFTGQMMHSSEWNPSINLKNKVVGVVGCGASAIQVIPGASSQGPKELHCFQRRPAWVMPKKQYQISTFIQKVFQFVPLVMWLYRVYIYIISDLRYSAFQDGSLANEIGTKIAKEHIKKQVAGDETLIEKLTPKFKLGCKRLLVSSEYYPTFTQPNVHLHCGEIEKVENRRVTNKNGDSHELDILILATGFRVHDFFAPLKIKLGDGEDLLSKWKNEGPQSLHGIMTSVAPNLFFVRGPNSALTNNSVIFMTECQVNFMLQVIKETEKRGAKTVRVREEAEMEWMKEIEKAMKTGTYYTGTCGGWYKDSRGVVTVLYPKRSVQYWWETRSVHSKSLRWTY